MFFGDFSWAFVHLVDKLCCCQVVTPPPGAGFRVLCPGLRDPPEASGMCHGELGEESYDDVLW